MPWAIWSSPTTTKAYGANPVVNTFVNKTDVLAQVRVNGELIESTTTHPYFTKNAGWKYAGDLKRGDILLLADGSESIIEESAKLRFLDNEISVYNFEVANDHTYFVGNTGVLVHNSGCAAGSLLSNSAGLTGEQLAALLGIGTVAGGAVAGTVIVDGIDSGTITLPGSKFIEDKKWEIYSNAAENKISIAISQVKSNKNQEQRIYYEITVNSGRPNRFRNVPQTLEEAILGIRNRSASYITLDALDARILIENAFMFDPTAVALLHTGETAFPHFHPYRFLNGRYEEIKVLGYSIHSYYIV